MLAFISTLQTSAGQAVIWLTVLCIVTLVSIYLLRRMRDHGGHEDESGDLLAKFGDLHRRGLLADAEFRTIRDAITNPLACDSLRDDDRS